VTKQDDKYEWLRFVEFGDKAIRFNEDKNTVIDSMDIFKEDGGRTKVPEVKLLQHLTSEFSFFTLGPVYTTCSVPFDIFGEFRAMMQTNDTPYDGPRLVLKFKRPVFQGLREWDCMLEAMHCGQDFERFVEFCTTQRIRVKGEQTYWAMQRYDMVIYDPLSIDDSVRAEDKKIVVTLLLPTGNRFQVLPQDSITLPPYGFRLASPNAGIVAEATTMLNIKGV
jgi:hypothetical protein